MPKRGLSPQMFKPKTSRGLNKQRIESKSGSGKRVVFKKEDPTNILQFVDTPDKWTEFEVHSWQEDGRWNFVPCAGDNCPLCDSEDEDIRYAGYRFACNVYNFSTKRVQILEGSKTLAGLIYHKFERRPKLFLKRVWEITRFPTKPITWDIDTADEEELKDVASLSLLDIDEYIVDEMKRYYGDDMPVESAGSSLEDDDDLDDEDDEDEEPAPKKRAAKKAAAPPAKPPRRKPAPAAADDDDEDDDDEDEDDDDLDDEDDDDLDLDDDDDDEDEPAPPPRRAKATAKKAAAPPRKRRVA
jgi:hypothetical protein